MTDTEQIIEIAKLDGWKNVGKTKGVPALNNRWSNPSKSVTAVETENLPPYLTSRDAIVPVIERQQFEIKSRITNFIKQRYTGWRGWDEQSVVNVMMATPANSVKHSFAQLESGKNDMKTAEEWCIEEIIICPDFEKDEDLIRKIQLDAYKQGMTDAAEICGKDAILLKRPEEWGFLSAKKQAILTARDNKTSL